MNNMIYIVVFRNDNSMIESVWSTIELARAAILYHSFNSNLPSDKYTIVEREINTAQLRQR